MATLGTNGTAGTLSATTDEGTATITCAAGSTITVRNATASANIARVKLSGVHGASDFAYVEVGDKDYFVSRDTNPVLTYKTDSGTATLYISIGVPAIVNR